MSEVTVTQFPAAAGLVSDRPTKRCTRCHRPRALDQFYRRVTASDGLFRICKQCCSAIDGTRKRERNIGIDLARAAAAADVHGGEI